MKTKIKGYIVLTLLLLVGGTPVFSKINILVHNYDKACGLLSFSLCCKLLDVPIDTEVVSLSHPVNKDGMSFLEIKNLASEYGVFSSAIRCDANTLFRNISHSRPAIIRSSLADHFYVTTGYFQKTKKIEIYDATSLTHKIITISEFKRLFRGEALLLDTTQIKLKKRYDSVLVIIVFTSICMAIIGFKVIWIKRII